MLTSPRFSGGGERAGSVDGYTLGFVNNTRSFEYNASRNNIDRRPPYFLRRTFPNCAFVEGWSEEELSDEPDDVAAATDISKTSKPALNPITPYAREIADVVWPQINNILRGGLGQRITTVDLSNFVRYFAMSLDCYHFLREAVILNYLAYHYDWSNIFPFTNVVPKEILAHANILNLDDPGLGKYWIPRMRRLEGRLMFPGILAESRRTLDPMISLDLASELWIPRRSLASDFDSLISTIDGYLDFIEVNLADEEAVLKTFLPFPLSMQSPWLVSSPGADGDRWNGLTNSGVINHTTFGDGSIPTDNAIRYVASFDDDTDRIIASSGIFNWLTMRGQPMWGSVKYGTIYATKSGATYHALTTPHSWDNFGIVDGWDQTTIASMVQTFDGTGDIAARDQAWFRDCRWAGAANDDISYGYFINGHILGTITGDSIQRLSELQSLADFSFEALQQLNAAVLGRSLREVQRTLAELVFGNV